MNRRRFCWRIGSVATAALASDTAFAAASGNRLCTQTAQALGTSIKLSVHHPSRRKAAMALTAALNEVRLVESLMSVYRRDSQVSRLNRQGILKVAHPYLVQLLRVAQRTCRETRGAFDITVQPLWKLHRDCCDRGELPSKEQIADARRRVGAGRIEIDGDTVRLKPGTQITLNGIAQGFATDCAKRALLDHGINDALIDIGEFAAVGRKSNEQPWRVGIQHPHNDESFVNVAPIQDRCLATSGDYETTFTEDFRSHHIFDPGTGQSPTELASVSILAPTATEADALSTSIFVMGIDKGVPLLSTRRTVDVLLVRKDGRIRATSGFPMESFT